MNTTRKGNLIGGVGAVLIGGAMLLFVATIIVNAIRDNAGSSLASDSEIYNGGPGNTGAADYIARARWNSTNATLASITSFLTIGVILLGVLGVTMVGAAIIGYISGAFGG